MSTGRVLWIIWCLFWAGCWFVTGALTLIGVVVCWPAAALSLLAILLPVGNPAAPGPGVCPLCGAEGDPVLLPAHWQAAHSRPAPPA